MHELGITQSIVAACAEQAHGARVIRVTVEIGELAALLPDAVRFCFAMCAEGTALEGAELDIVQVAGRGRCRACGAELTLHQPYGRCGCGCGELDLVAGQELLIRQMEVL